ncbi:Zn-dependent hydrolase, partial [bacterium]
VLGVIAGLEVVRTLNDLAIKTKHPIVVVNWTNEEGARFAPAMLASGVFAGLHDEAWAKDRVDAKGKRFGDELKRIGWEGEEPVGGRKMKAFFEYHIEQGPILESEAIDIGVVTHGQGLKWLQVTLTGKESHTGSTPMFKRRNAGLGMARIVELVHEVAMDEQPDAVGAVGHVEIYPNSRNIIPGRAVFTIDIRSPDKDTLDRMEERIEDGIDTICEALDIEFEIEEVGQFDPVTFDETCVAAVRSAADSLGYSHRDIVSGAGHDACWINRVAPTAMIFCPCVDGLSHNEAEEISKEWAKAGADVLLRAVVETAEIVA